MAERDLIAAIERRLSLRADRVLRGPGDDAAVVRARALAVTSIDTFVEGVHFRLSTHNHADVGHKALAAALSDLAAMGAGAGEAYVALGLPAGTGRELALELVEAMEALADRVGAVIAGGDVVDSPLLVVSVTVTGWVDDAHALTYRDGARPGDLVGVSGELGGAAGGLLLLEGQRSDLPEAVSAGLLERQRRPEPRLALGQALSQAGAGALIDLSDGVATDARHIAARSGVRVSIRLGELPLAAGVVEVAAAAGRDPHQLGAGGGEDYELLVTVPAARRDAAEAAALSAGVPLTWVGEVTEGTDLELLDVDGSSVELSGHEHLMEG